MYTIREAILAFRRAPLLAGLSAAMVGLALFVVGLFSLATYNLRLALESVEERIEIVVYIRDGTRNDEILLARRELSALPEVLGVELITKEEALDIARRDLPEFGELFTDLAVNPLPASLELQLRPGRRDPETVARVATRAQVYPFVEDVQFGHEWVDKLFTLRRVGGLTASVLGAAFALVAALIIGAAVRIAVFARKEEIRIMQLVGARNGFIRRPFLVEGAITGLLGGLLALALTYGTFWVVYRYLFSLAWIPADWAGLGLLSGTLFGVFATGVAVRKYLREV
ncbi:MAG: permease-like cell division protein FtsX [Gemmatimonadota bacterium]|nr:MAG: permease-like cell division protein FtsX [Gemmatimonadota bacterium]